MEGIKRGLGAHASSKQLTESAAIACVKLCKASTYINICDSNNVTFQLVQSVINDLKVKFVSNRFSVSCAVLVMVYRHYYLIQLNRFHAVKDTVFRILIL